MIRYDLHLDWRPELEASADNASDLRLLAEQALSEGKAFFAEVSRVTPIPGFKDMGTVEVIFSGGSVPLKDYRDYEPLRPEKRTRPSALAEDPGD